MPFFLAKVSHFVGALGLGRGFQRGRGVIDCEGRVKNTPSGVEWIGQVVRSWLIRTWAPSRAMAWRARFVVVLRLVRRVDVGERGLGSWARRCARSKV